MNKRFGNFINNGFWNVLDWVYPPVCAGCGEPGYRLCENCQNKIQFESAKKYNTHRVCETNSIQSPLPHQTDMPGWVAKRHLAQYEGVIRDCIHALKYKNNQSLGELFSGWLADLVYEENWQIDLVMPVPLSQQRVRERGYNQSALIARPLAALLNIHYNPFGLERIRNTPSQVGLSAEERHQNVTGAFRAFPEIVKGKHILLVDDVTTTGATLEACTSALITAGARAVYCVTIAGFHNKIAAESVMLTTE